MYLLYFDPGLGAMVIQAIIAAVAGVGFYSDINSSKQLK